MADNFGYQPAALPSYAQVYTDYLHGEVTDYQPTNWGDKDNVNIISLWSAIQTDSDEEARGLSEMWRRLSVLLDATRADIERHATSLQAGWQSPPRQGVLRNVGAAPDSLGQRAPGAA